jgi:hypothetical protein
MFIGYISSFFIALLLSFFYINYAASGVFEQIGKELKSETGEKSEEITQPDSGQSSNESRDFIFNHFIELAESNQQTGVRESEVDIPTDTVDVPVNKICLSEYYLRPPPAEILL